MRGEHLIGLVSVPQSKGSSPHARGAPAYSAAMLSINGIIPACAGSTYLLACCFVLCWDHPRMRGEHSTPCGVEKLKGDHPRMRGEHDEYLSHIFRVMGSSPHARGAQGDAVVVNHNDGIIPACAGSTTIVYTDNTTYTGSSPHARGARCRAGRDGDGAGIIPACAGSTGRRRPATAGGRDHPRMRGEHNPANAGTGPHWGSSPHARGALIPVRSMIHSKGIIPACAGSTRTCRAT